MKFEDMKEALGCVFVFCNFDILDSEFMADLLASRGDNSCSTPCKESPLTHSKEPRQEPSTRCPWTPGFGEHVQSRSRFPELD